VPVWETLVALGAGRGMAGAVHLVDSPAEALALLGR
jgi:hypothetical protein